MIEDTCPTGKKCFSSWTEAERSLKFIAKHGDRKTKARRVGRTGVTFVVGTT